MLTYAEVFKKKMKKTKQEKKTRELKRHPKMRHLLQDEDTPTVTFPDDYPNSVRHFLLIGFLGMFIGAIVFFYMGISRKVNTVMHVLTFFIAAVSACAYYAEWAGLGVEYKTTDTTPRVIFWAHYLDWVVTGPVCARSFSLPATGYAALA
jgi:hypothetical protein